MTVSQMLKSMSQKELCNWIAYFRIESEEWEAKQEESQTSRVIVKDKSKDVEQAQKDGALFQQLMALAGQGLVTFECNDE